MLTASFEDLSSDVDEFLRVKWISRPGETISSTGLEARAGGKGANQSVSIAKAGGSVDFLGSVGRGRGDDWIVDRLKDSGVGVEKVEFVEEKTGRAIIQVAENGENSIVLFKGANYHNRAPSPADFTPIPTHIVLQNEIPLESTIQYLTLASSDGRNAATIFNPSPLPSEQEISSFPWAKVSWLIVNEGEAEDLLAVLDPQGPNDAGTEAGASSTLRRLSKAINTPTTNVVLTLGASGVISTYHVSSSWDPVHVPSIQLRGATRDTTGAGDCFTGYFVAGLMELFNETHSHDVGKEEARRLLERCVVAAGMCCEEEGTLDSVPLKVEVEERMRGSAK